MIQEPLIPAVGNASGCWQLTTPPGFQLYQFALQAGSDQQCTIVAAAPILYWVICLEGPLQLRSSNVTAVLPAHMALMSKVGTEPEIVEAYHHRATKGWILVLPMLKVKEWLDNNLATNWWPYFEDYYISSRFKEHFQLLPLAQEQFFHQLPAIEPAILSYKHQVALEYHAFLIMEQVLFAQGKGDHENLANDEARVMGLVSFILEELDRPITLELLMKHTGLNLARLQRLCQQLFGASVNGFVQLMRIEKAKELLTKSNDPILSIATQVGFASPGYFSQVFKQRVGVEPSVFRKRGLNGTD